MGVLEKMKIISYEDDEFTSKLSSTSVMINPDKYTHQFAIQYTQGCTMGASGGSPKFNKYGNEEVSFETVYDATGVVTLIGLGLTGVKPNIDELKSVVYNYNSSSHEPNYVQLVWGQFIFNCRLTEMSITYTLFKPDGSPLRARVNLKFKGFTSADDLAKQENKNSPDMTHIVEVKKGDTLPLLCYKIYKDSSYYLKVAEKNNITDIRNIKPGHKLFFPPVI